MARNKKGMAREGAVQRITPEQKAGSEKTGIVSWLLVFAIIALGLVLRLLLLGQENYWYDESYTVQHLQQPTLGRMLSSVREYELYNPPVYYSLLFGWSRLSGLSETALRSFSVLFSTLSILLLYLVARQLFSHRTSWIAALIFAMSPLQLSFAQEARAYAFFIFLTLCSFFFFLRMMREQRTSDLVLYLVASALSLYTMVLALLTFLVQNLVFFFHHYPERPGRLKAWLIAQATLAFFFLAGSVTFFIPSIISNVDDGLTQFVQRFGFPAFLKGILIVGFFAAFALVAAAILLQVRRRWPASWVQRLLLPRRLFLVLMALCLVGELFLLPKVWRAFFLVRYTVFLYFIGYLFIAANIAARQRALRYLVLALFLLVQSFLIIDYFATPTKTPWQEIIGHVGAEAKPGDIILFGGGKFAYDYYDRSALPKVELMPVEVAVVERRVAAKDIDEALGQHPVTGIWFITFRQWAAKPYKDELDSRFALRSEKVFLDTAVYYYAVR
ncbi:MAG: glycosyltransferase family 39 protein [Nanoarchaeota archaeon]